MLKGKPLVVWPTLLLLLPFWFAAPSLATTPQEQEIRRIIEVLNNPKSSYEEQEAAPGRLIKIGQPAVLALIQALKGNDALGRSAAASVLGQMGPLAKEAIPDLSNALKDNDYRVRFAAAVSLGQMGPLAVPALIQVLKGNDALGRFAAARALKQMGPLAKEAIPDLSNALKDNDYSVRLAAASALGQMGQPAVPALIQALKGNDYGLRIATASVLGEMGPAAQEAIPDLIQALEEDSEVRSAAAGALGKMGPAAVPPLSKALKNNDYRVRLAAASVLGKIGPAAQDALPDLIQALRDDDDRVRFAAADALGQMGPATEKAIQAINRGLGDNDLWVRLTAAWSLGHKGLASKVSIPALKLALYDDISIRRAAARALGEIGPAAEGAVPDFVAAFGEADQSDREIAAKALLKIVPPGENLDRAALQKKVSQLKNLRETIFKDFSEPANKYLADELSKMLRLSRAEYEKQPPFWRELFDKYKDRMWAMAMAGYVALLVVVLPIWFLLLWLRPIRLYWLNEKVSWVALKLPYIEGPVGLRQLIFLAPFHYCNRVLDAWIRGHLSQARTSFAALDTVKDRAVHVPIPVTLNGHTLAQPSPEDFQEVFRKTPFCLIICGEGGSGKTSIACQLAGWALTEDQVPMLAKHRLLPVLIEHDLKIEDAPGQNPMLEAIRKQVVERMTAGREIAPELLRQLLGQQRLLVIVDHYSELSSQTRERIHPGYDPQLPLHAMIVTSRQEEKFQGSVTDTLKPLRIRGNRLSSFMEAYLTQRGKRELYDDTEFFAACSRLTEIVGDRNITVLLARMFADQMIATKEDPDFQDLPHNIPDLMLSYLNWINRSGKEENPTVQRITKAISWASLEPTFRPTDASLAAIHQALAGEPELDQKLQYLCRDLGIIRCVGPAEDKVRVTLDPLAEYLAGLRLLELYGDREESWKAFLEEADKKEGAPKSIEGFLLAVRDCCLAKGKEYGVPEFVEQELAQKAGINLESKAG